MARFHKIRTFVLLLAVSALISASVPARPAPPERVLFVGNSYTYFWNLPQNVAAMAESRGRTLSCRQSTAGGVNLGQHWRGQKDLSSLEIIREGDFDAVVLQDHSMRAIDHPDSLMLFGKRFAQEAKAKGADVYLYMTWAREFNPYMQKAVREGYEALAEEIGATVVPVGPAWERARELRPGLPLYDADQSHPSPLGTYLSACVFYGALTGESPVGLPHRLTARDADGERIYLNIQSEGDALFCQSVAEDVLANYGK